MPQALIQKTVLESKLASLRAKLVFGKLTMPTNRQEIEEDIALNQTLLAEVREIRGDPYFRDIILEGKTHRDFLDGWEDLEQFSIRWTFPYELLSVSGWRLEQEEISEILEKLRKPKVIGAL